MEKNFLIILLLMFVTSCSSLGGDSAYQQDQKKKVKIAEINLQLGIAYLDKGDIERAKQKLLYAANTAPNLPEVWYTMAYFQEKSGNNAEANANYLKAIKLAPNRGDVQNNYGTFLCRTGRYADSIQYFTAAIKDPQYLEVAGAYENAGLCALKIPDKKLAKNYFTKALESDPNRPVSLAQFDQLRLIS